MEYTNADRRKILETMRFLIFTMSDERLSALARILLDEIEEMESKE